MNAEGVESMALLTLPPQTRRLLASIRTRLHSMYSLARRTCTKLRAWVPPTRCARFSCATARG